MLSVIIPNHNGVQTIDRCLEHLFASDHDDFEVIVVDDASTDDSVARIGKFPCHLIAMAVRGGTSRARNLGAGSARGDILLFIDADCLVLDSTLRLAVAAARRHGRQAVVGGTYTRQPADSGFFNTFQSLFIHHCESKQPGSPDYVSGHAMVIHTRTFHEHGGFPEHFLPILEDVEFSHRLRRQGIKLVMEPELMVRHVFNFNLFRSLANAVRKSRYWVLYSLKNRDLLADSGTASLELKLNAVILGVIFLLMPLPLHLPQAAAVAIFLQLGNALVQRRLFTEFFRNGGFGFAGAAIAYYTFVYPLAVVSGGLVGAGTHILDKLILQDSAGRKKNFARADHSRSAQHASCSKPRSETAMILNSSESA